VRVRRTIIDDADLSLFEFDYDLTLMIFFLDAAENIYGRYGGRDSEGPDTRQSLAGLRYAAEATLKMHDQGTPIKRGRAQPRYIRDFPAANRQRCVHCHQAKEIIYDQLRRDGKWSRDLIWRYPLPDRLGLVLEIDRGNVVEQVSPDSPASRLGLQAGDVVRSLAEVPIHSFADAQYALDRAPPKGTITARWQREGETLTGKLDLPAGWRKTDITWRPSMRTVIPSARVYGRDLTAQERQLHGLTATELAFWQGYPVSSPAKAAGVREGDIILGFDDKQLELEAYDFLGFVRRNYLVGDRVTINLLRDKKRLAIPMTLR